MRVPISWLKEYVDFELTPAELAERLTMAGIAVEAIEDLAAPLRGIVIGRVERLSQHPSLPKLLLAETDWGKGPRTLVTGAKNLAAGDLVPVAPAGTALPGGKRIEAAEFGGVVSQGMLCSAAELGLEKQSDGILVLEGEWPLGAPVARALGLEEIVLELELTPNRADCLCLLGVAREVAALTGGKLHPPTASPRADGPPIADLALVEVADPDLCPRYGGKVFLEVRIEPSPAWLQHRLRAAGVRPINNIVDITNYVMLELNQPLHAFDLDRLTDRRLIIRRARPGEKIRTLDGTERELPADALAITDPGGPVAVAGVMGGADSEVTAETTRIFLEGAYFDRVSVRRTARALAMRTEASLRFERGIDPAGVVTALDRAARLLEEIGAGRVAAGTIDAAAGTWGPRKIHADSACLNGLLGTALPAGEMAGYLERLGFGVNVDRAGLLEVNVPTRRQDVEGPADLAEEVARLHGYDRIPSAYPASCQVGQRTAAQSFATKARRVMRGLGQTEIVTYSLCSPRLYDQLGLSGEAAQRALRILAPLSEEWSVMRPTLLGGILETLATNARRGIGDAAVFEQARVYLPVAGEELASEPLHLAGGLMGLVSPRTWAEKPRICDFYDLKGLLEAFLEGLGVAGASFAPDTHPALHPGRCASLRAPGGTVLGHCGEAHPKVAAAFDLRGPVFLYELDLGALAARSRAEIKVASPPRFPAILRDLAVVVPADLPLHDLEQALQEMAGDLLASTELFDVYTGAQVGTDGKSMAFALSFRAPDRTLTDAEVNEIMGRLVAGLGRKFGAKLR